MNLLTKLNTINQSSFIKKIISGTFWMTLGTIISRGLLALASILLTRVLTIEEYGEFGMVKSTIDNFLIFASMGIGLTTTKYMSELKDVDSKKASSLLGASLSLVVILSTIVAAIICIFSNYIAGSFLNNSNLALGLSIGGVTLIFIAINGTQMGALIGFQAFQKNSLSNILQGLFLFVGLVIGGYLYGVEGALVGNLIAIFLLSIVLQCFLKSESIKYGIFSNLEHWKSNIKLICKFAIPASLSTIIVAPTIWILNSILVNQNNGYKELGLYSAVIIFSTAIQMFNGAISNVLLTIFLSKSEDKSPKKEFFNYFGSWIISIIIALPLIIFPEIVSYILGSQYEVEQIVPILGMSIVSTLVITNRSGVARDLIVKNRMWLSVLSMGQWAVTNLIMFYFLRHHGAIGFAFSYMVSYLINYVIFLPCFISKKISPSVIFYSKWNCLLWVLILVLVSVNIVLYKEVLVRSISSPILIGLIFISIVNLYKQCLKEF